MTQSLAERLEKKEAREFLCWYYYVLFKRLLRPSTFLGMAFSVSNFNKLAYGQIKVHLTPIFDYLLFLFFSNFQKTFAWYWSYNRRWLYDLWCCKNFLERSTSSTSRRGPNFSKWENSHKVFTRNCTFARLV